MAIIDAKNGDNREFTPNYILCAVIFGVVTAVLVSLRFGWTSSMHPIIGMDCKCKYPPKNKNSPAAASNVNEESITETSDALYASTDALKCAKTCIITAQGFDRRFKATYTKNRTIPAVGRSIRVYYHSKKREATATLKSAPYGMLATITGLLCLSQIASIFLT